VKQVIVVNDSLDLPPGKLAAQVAHGAIAAYLEAEGRAQELWLAECMPKVVVHGGEIEMARLETLAMAKGIPLALIRDAGKTVVAPGTLTCLGLGPATDEEIDSVTGALPLL